MERTKRLVRAGPRFPLAACVSGWAMLHREPVIIEDLDADARVPAAACRMAVEAHRGPIWIEPNRPQGTAFVVDLPRA